MLISPISREKKSILLQEESFDDAHMTSQTPTKNEPENNDLDMDVTCGVTPPVKKPPTSVESMLRFLGSKEEGAGSPKKAGRHYDTNYEPIEQEESDFDDHVVDNAGEVTPSRRSKRLLETPEISQYAKKPKVMAQIGLGSPPKKPIGKKHALKKYNQFALNTI